MTNHEPAHKSTPETDVSTVETVGKPESDNTPLAFGYDPAHLGSLSAHQMDAIEDQAWRDAESGLPIEEVQARVYDMATKLGLDLSKAQENALVIRYVGVDGKTDVRAINLSATDFGTRIANAELTEVASRPEEGHKDEIDEEEAAKAERAVNEIKVEVERVKRTLVDSLEQSAGQGARTEQALESIYEAGRILMRKMENHEELRGIFAQVEEAIATTRARAKAYSGALDDTVRYSRGSAEVFDQALKLAGGVNPSADDLGRSAKKSLGMLEELRRVQGRASEGNAVLARSLSRLDSLVNEMRHSRYGMEVYATELRTLLAGIADLANDGRVVRKGFASVAETLHSI